MWKELMIGIGILLLFFLILNNEGSFNSVSGSFAQQTGDLVRILQGRQTASGGRPT